MSSSSRSSRARSNASSRPRTSSTPGKMAREIAEFMQAGGGLITVEDLKNYDVMERTAVRGTYRGLEVISAPPPSSGGIALVETLNMLEGFDLAKAGFGSAESIHWSPKPIDARSTIAPNSSAIRNSASCR